MYVLYIRTSSEALQWIAPDTPVREVCSSGEECSMFRNLGVIDLTKDIHVCGDMVAAYLYDA